MAGNDFEPDSEWEDLEEQGRVLRVYGFNSVTNAYRMRVMRKHGDQSEVGEVYELPASVIREQYQKL